MFNDVFDKLIKSLGYSNLKDHLETLLEIQALYGDRSGATADVLRQGGKRTTFLIQHMLRSNAEKDFSRVLFLLEGWDSKYLLELKTVILNYLKQQTNRYSFANDIRNVLAILLKARVINRDELLTFFESKKVIHETYLTCPELVAAVELEAFLDQGEFESYEQLTDLHIKALATGRYEKDIRAGDLINVLSFDRIEPYAFEFLEFLQDINWPASGSVIAPLSRGGKKVIPFIRRVFKEHSDDSWWCYSVVMSLVPSLDKEVIISLKNDILNLCRENLFRGERYPVSNEQLSDVIEYLAMLRAQEVMEQDELLCFFKTKRLENNFLIAWVEKTAKDF